jgi:hypothetical protein
MRNGDVKSQCCRSLTFFGRLTRLFFFLKTRETPGYHSARGIWQGARRKLQKREIQRARVGEWTQSCDTLDYSRSQRIESELRLKIESLRDSLRLVLANPLEQKEGFAP